MGTITRSSCNAGLFADSFPHPPWVGDIFFEYFVPEITGIAKSRIKNSMILNQRVLKKITKKDTLLGELLCKIYFSLKINANRKLQM